MASSKVILKGKKVLERNVDFLTPEQIRDHLQKLVGGDRRLMVKRGSEVRPLDRFPKDFNLGSDVRLTDFPASTSKGAISTRERYIKAQVASVAEVYGERYGQPIQLDSRLRFVVIPCFTLPRKWGYKVTPLLVWFPATYPTAAPDGFYLSQQCRGPHIFARPVGSHAAQSEDLSGKGWNWYCMHTSWKPGSDPLDGDTLWTFLEMAKSCFTIDEF